MSNHRYRWVGLSAIVVACGTIGFVFIASDDALAGPGEELEIDGATLGTGEVTRLSIPLTPEEMGVEADAPPPVPTAAPTYVYVNMDGANLVCGTGDNATTNSSVIACQYNFTGPYPAYGGSLAQRQSVLDAVKADWAPFNVIITDQRPAQGPYTMCMTGAANHPFGNNVLGIAPLDCNNYVASNIVFAFHSAAQLGGFFGPNTQATTISQEVAHAFGLEHVGSSSDIMNPYNQGGNPSFTDTCIQIVTTGGQGIVCNQQHLKYCPSGSQNSYQELMGMFGPSDPDDQPPSVAVVYPHHGELFASGANFVIECQASDNQGVDAVELWINSTKMGATLSASPYEWDVTNIPAGQYDIYCIAHDEWDNTAMSSVVSILVEEGGQPGDTGADSDSGGNDSGGEESGGGESEGETGQDSGDEDSGGFGSGGLPPGFGFEESDNGCACTSEGPRQPAWMLLLLLGLPLLRRPS